LRAVALVAHPDDCVIFAWPFIEAHPEFEWKIVYMTYLSTDPRGKEIKEYWDRRTIPTEFLGNADTWLDMVRGKISFDTAQASQDLIKSAQNADLILTHYKDGDYGHIHHKFVNQVAEQIDKPKVYFASTFNYNTEYTVLDSVAVDELPLHREVIIGFQDRNTGRYIVTPEAERILKEKQ
jgi:LmbE family N-acetylglucosaminyl deacetylase